MMRRMLLIACVLLLLYSPHPAHATFSSSGARLTGLTHNAPNTGKMLPSAFDPQQTTYLLTVADWVSRITFTPAAAADARITVNGQNVASGQKSQVIQMSNDPQAVAIAVEAPGQGSTVYTVYLQRRPSERRTRVSAGYLTDLRMEGDACWISADLVTLTYQPQSNRSTFLNDTVYDYRYRCADSCIFYSGSAQHPVRAWDARQFAQSAAIGSMYTFIYIEDQIVAVFPYGSEAGN